MVWIYFKRAGKKCRRDLFDMENMSLFSMRCRWNTRTCDATSPDFIFRDTSCTVHSHHEMECSQPLLLVSGGDSEVVYYISRSIKSTKLILKNCGHRFIYIFCHQHGYRSCCMRGQKIVTLTWCYEWNVLWKCDAQRMEQARARSWTFMQRDTDLSIRCCPDRSKCEIYLFQLNSDELCRLQLVSERAN